MRHELGSNRKDLPPVTGARGYGVSRDHVTSTWASKRLKRHCLVRRDVLRHNRGMVIDVVHKKFLGISRLMVTRWGSMTMDQISLSHCVRSDNYKLVGGALSISIW